MTTQATSATKRNTTKRTSNRRNTRSKVTNPTTANEPKHVSEIIPEAVEEIKNTRESKREAARQKRAELKALSNQLKKAVYAGMIPPSDDGTINGLLKEMYAKQGHTELHTFDEWKERGYIVRKGQKAILLWGKPRKPNKEDEETAASDEASEANNAKDDFFPVCYVFSNLQVHAINQPAAQA